MNPRTRGLRKVAPGDSISARQHNIIVRELMRSQSFPNSFSSRSGTAQGFRRRRSLLRATPDSGTFTEYQVAGVAGVSQSDPGIIVYSIEVYDPPNTPEYDVVIIGDKGISSSSGLVECFYGNEPCIAEITGSVSVGDICGPYRADKTLRSNEPGFRVVGETDTSGFYWVLREQGNSAGVGEMVTSSTFDPDAFHSGFNIWDGSTHITIYNTFVDSPSAGDIVLFEWEVTNTRYIIKNIQC